MKKVAIVGTVGVPAKYGGFETLVENLIGEHCSAEIDYTVFCSGKAYPPPRLKTYKNARLKYVPLHANGMQSIPYDIWSLIRTVGRGYDVVLVLGVSGCLFLPLYRLVFRKKIIVNIDGLEHKRDKWGKFARKFLLISERYAVRHADVIIADNKVIQDYVTETYHKPSVLIAYGGDHAAVPVSPVRQHEILDRFGVQSKTYACTVCRIEPENNCHLILEAFSKTNIPLVFIGNWDISTYGRSLKSKYGNCDNIRIVDPVYDREQLFVLRKQCRFYVHGHSAGGTNPSLVEAMFCDVPVLAFDVGYNRETTGHQACYWSTPDELTTLAVDGIDSSMQSCMGRLANEHYTWQKIVSQYEATY